ncbi:MAG: hypothetical protein IT289_10665 [Oligoflexia bacterium]|nr:hypothetical protein [Oligoflexia bacterium]
MERKVVVVLSVIGLVLSLATFAWGALPVAPAKTEVRAGSAKPQGPVAPVAAPDVAPQATDELKPGTKLLFFIEGQKYTVTFEKDKDKSYLNIIPADPKLASVKVETKAKLVGEAEKEGEKEIRERFAKKEEINEDEKKERDERVARCETKLVNNEEVAIESEREAFSCKKRRLDKLKRSTKQSDREEAVSLMSELKSDMLSRLQRAQLMGDKTEIEKIKREYGALFKDLARTGRGEIRQIAGEAFLSLSTQEYFARREKLTAMADEITMLVQSGNYTMARAKLTEFNINLQGFDQMQREAQMSAREVQTWQITMPAVTETLARVLDPSTQNDVMQLNQIARVAQQKIALGSTNPRTGTSSGDDLDSIINRLMGNASRSQDGTSGLFTDSRFSDGILRQNGDNQTWRGMGIQQGPQFPTRFGSGLTAGNSTFQPIGGVGGFTPGSGATGLTGAAMPNGTTFPGQVIPPTNTGRSGGLRGF